MLILIAIEYKLRNGVLAPTPNRLETIVNLCAGTH